MSQGARGESPAELPVLDAATLDGLFHLEKAVGREIVRLVVDNFKAETPGRVARMRQAIERGDVEAFGFAAHVLKGSAAQLGAVRLAELCGELEGVSRKGSLEGVGERIRLVEEETLRALNALLERLRREGKADASGRSASPQPA